MDRSRWAGDEGTSTRRRPDRRPVLLAALLALAVAAVGSLLVVPAVRVSGQPVPPAAGQLIGGGTDTPSVSLSSEAIFGLFGHRAPAVMPVAGSISQLTGSFVNVGGQSEGYGLLSVVVFINRGQGISPNQLACTVLLPATAPPGMKVTCPLPPSPASLTVEAGDQISVFIGIESNGAAWIATWAALFTPRTGPTPPPPTTIPTPTPKPTPTPTPLPTPTLVPTPTPTSKPTLAPAVVSAPASTPTAAPTPTTKPTATPMAR